MPDPSATGPLPPDVAVRVRAYLAAFLPPDAIDEAVDEVAADSRFWGDTDAVEILAVAHTVLASRLRVAPEVEVLVLEEEVGLSVPEVAAVLGLPVAQVRGMLDEALAVLADPDLADATPGGTAPAPPADVSQRTPSSSPTPPAPTTPSAPTARPAPEGRSRRRTRVLAIALAVAAAVVALAAAWLAGGDDTCPPEASVCIDEAVLTDRIDATTGAPGPARDEFDVEDPITLWVSLERRAPAPDPLEVRWYRDEVLLYGTEVRVGEEERLNVSLAPLWSGEPGRYRAEVLQGERVLFVRDFRVTAG